MTPQEGGHVSGSAAGSEGAASQSALPQSLADLRAPTERAAPSTGPNTMPALRDLSQAPEDVALATTAHHAQTVKAFIDDLNAMDVPESARALPELDVLRAAHPADAEAHCTLLQGCAVAAHRCTLSKTCKRSLVMQRACMVAEINAVGCSWRSRAPRGAQCTP